MRSPRRLLRSVLARSADQVLQQLLPRLTPSQLERLLGQVVVGLESKTKTSLTYHKRPLLAESVGTWSDPLVQDPPFALIIQGPIIKENDFTLNSIRIYKKNFRNTHIILSTWDDENDGYLDSIRNESIELIQSRKPDCAGIANINLQIVSSYAGIQKAESLGVTHVLKTRTDQRLYAPNIPEFLCDLLDVFPVVTGYRQRQRLIAISLNTFKYRLYGVSDMLVFGKTEDMMCYFGCPLDARSLEPPTTDISVLAWSKLRLAETYLTTEFLDSIGRALVWTLEDSWQVLADHFVVIDKETLDLLWPKYNRSEHRWLQYEGIFTNFELNFREWLRLYTGLDNKKNINYEFLNLPFGYTYDWPEFLTEDTVKV